MPTAFYGIVARTDTVTIGIVELHVQVLIIERLAAKTLILPLHAEILKRHSRSAAETHTKTGRHVTVLFSWPAGIVWEDAAWPRVILKASLVKELPQWGHRNRGPGNTENNI